MKFNFKPVITGMVLVGLLFATSEGSAQLRIESVYPSLGVIGQGLEVTMKGTGFDANTRVSMYLDVGNRKAVLGSVDTPGYAFSIAVVDHRAYVADGDNGLHVIDISNPASPQVIGSVDTPGDAYGLTVADNRAYVADGGGGLQVIDIGNPANPQIIGSVDTPGTAWGVTVMGSRAYVADGSGGLQVIDVSNPASPQIIGSANMLPGFAYGITVMGGRAYVANYVTGLLVVDISNPASPQVIGSVDTPGYATGVTLAGSTAYVADGDNGLHVIDISDPANPQIIGSVDTPGTAWGVTVVGDRAYVTDGYSGLQVINISNPASPQIIGSVDTPGEAWGVTVAGDRAYVADYGSGLQVIDVSNPVNPQVTGWLDTPGHAYALTLVGSTAYVADGDNGLQVINISDPANPQIIGSVDTPGTAWGVTVMGSRAYVADGSGGLQVIDVSNPASPQIIGSANMLPGFACGVTVVGDRAYVADGSGGLQVIDVSNPASPQIIGSVDTPGYASGVTLAGNTAYVADGGTGLQVIDISDPANPQIIGSADTGDTAFGITVVGNTAYVADRTGGLMIVPVPVEVSPVVVNSPTSISITLPSPQIPGHYTLRVFNGTQSYELPGAVTFLSAEDYAAKTQERAIIVAGGGPFLGNTLWEATQRCANLAYLSLLSQGYTRDNIYYLSPRTNVDVDGDGLLNDIDGETTLANLSYAINTWAKSANEVLVYMTDHGGSRTFMLNGTKSPVEQINADTLDAWLDSLQETMLGKVLFIYDACYSGSFVSRLTPPAGKERIVITSTLPDQRAWFLMNGALSFSYQFWASIFLNANLYVSWGTAGNMMKNDQIALLDVNGNGIANEKEDRNLANNIIIGRGRVAASLPPIIGTAWWERAGDTSAVLKAGSVDSLQPIARVWAVITPPDYDPGLSDQPVVDLPTVELLDPDQDGLYEGLYENFNQWGTYRISVFAKDTEGAYSLPKQMTLTQESGPDKFENDDTYPSASVINIGDPQAQRHNFHDQGDQDWVKFYAVAGETYEIKVENLQSKCDAVLVLYDRNGTTRLTNPDPPYNEGDSGLYGESELITWQCPADGIYYVMVKEYTSTDFGPDTGYDLRVYRPSAPNPGYLKGKVSDAQDVGVSGAVLRSNIVNATAISMPGGYYLMCLPPGTYSITVEAQGFSPQSQAGIAVNELSTVNLNFALSSSLQAMKGDMNNDNKVDLTDLIIVLRCLARFDLTDLIRDNYSSSGADVNGDNKVGIEEAVYILQELAGMR
jgi:hypothetical protein